jgi:U1 small nuclear ribonucleoprotein C
MSVRKAHNSGRNHLRNVVDYYQQIGHEKAQSVIDSITSSYAAEGQAHANPMLPQNQPGHGGPLGMPGGFPAGMPPPFPGMPPLPGMPGAPPLPPGAFGGQGLPRKSQKYPYSFAIYAQPDRWVLTRTII